MEITRRQKNQGNEDNGALKVLGYVRVSTIGQADNTSLKDQERKIREFCRLNDYDLVEIFRDVQSGASTSRGGFQAMLNELDTNGFDGIVAYRIDRLYRSLIAMADLFAKLDRTNKFVHTVDGTDTRTKSGKMMAEMMGLIAGWERTIITERLAGGRIANFEKHGKQGGAGNGATGKAPFGFYWDGDKLLIDQEKAHLVREIFEKRKAGDSLGAIASYLDSNGVTTNRGGKFSRQAVKIILENRYYIGEANYGDWRAKSHHQPIVSTKLFNAVNGFDANPDYTKKTAVDGGFQP